MSVSTYDPAQILITIAGNLITGIAPDTFVKVSRDEDAFTKQVGADGEVARSRNRNRAGSIEVTLMQSSASNDALSALAAQDELAGTGVGEAMIKDLLGTSIHHAPNAWVKKVPDAEYGKESGTRSWVIDCDRIDGVVGSF